MKRRLESEKLKPVRDFDAWEFALKCARWAQDNRKVLALARPRFPRGITDRLADTWHPLLAIADEVGVEWPRLAKPSMQSSC